MKHCFWNHEANPWEWDTGNIGNDNGANSQHRESSSCTTEIRHGAMQGLGNRFCNPHLSSKESWNFLQVGFDSCSFPDHVFSKTRLLSSRMGCPLLKSDDTTLLPHDLYHSFVHRPKPCHPISAQCSVLYNSDNSDNSFLLHSQLSCLSLIRI